MIESSEVGMLKLTVARGREEDFVWRVAEQIQQLPGVLRVRVECTHHQIEIIYRYPAEGLLRSVHDAFRSAGKEAVADGTY